MLCYIADINSGYAAAAHAGPNAGIFAYESPTQAAAYEAELLNEAGAVPVHNQMEAAAYEDAAYEAELLNEAGAVPVHNQMEAAAEVRRGVPPAVEFDITSLCYNRQWRAAVNNLVLGKLKGPSSHCLASVVSLEPMKTNGIWYVYHRSACGDVQGVTQ